RQRQAEGWKRGPRHCERRVEIGAVRRCPAVPAAVFKWTPILVIGPGYGNSANADLPDDPGLGAQKRPARRRPRGARGEQCLAGESLLVEDGALVNRGDRVLVQVVAGGGPGRLCGRLVGRGA